MELESSGYYALGIPAYVAVCAGEMAWARHKGKQVYRFGSTVSNLSAGLGEVLVGLFLGPLLLAAYDFGYRLSPVRWAPGSWVPWMLAFVLGDLCYYLYHRAGHSVAALWAIHGVHHQAEELNFTVAIRHPWFSDAYSALFYAPIPLLGVPTTHFFVAISIISFYAFTVHTELFHRPSFGFLVTPRTHVVHHAKNARYLHKNYGAMFTVWDKLFGTHAELDPDEPPRIGSMLPYATHDGALAQWVYFSRLFAAAKQTRSWREKLAIFVKHPGYLPAGVSLPAPTAARSDGAIPFRSRVYVGLHLAVLVVFATPLLWQRERFSTAVLAVGATVLVLGLSSLGGLLDGRAFALRHERIRLVVALVATPWLAPRVGWPAVLLGVASLGGLVATVVGTVITTSPPEPARVEPTA